MSSALHAYQGAALNEFEDFPGDKLGNERRESIGGYEWRVAPRATSADSLSGLFEVLRPGMDVRDHIDALQG